ncbi:MAG TPA: arsenate reductase ArsC [Dehalococcoidales bacterium]|nr:arsenate reductase ArsC [Dehalococcoidales bacterium]
MKKILFVCVHNAGRSQMAEAFFNHFAKGKAIAVSAGTQPEPSLSVNSVKVMREAGIELNGHEPKLLTLEMLEDADRVITMGCYVEDACPSSSVATEDWALGNPKGQPLEEVRIIRDRIKAKVQGLINEL